VATGGAVMKKPTRQSYPLPQIHVVMLEALLAQALQQNAPVAQGLQALALSLKLDATYVLRLKATFEPVSEPEKRA